MRPISTTHPSVRETQPVRPQTERWITLFGHDISHDDIDSLERQLAAHSLLSESIDGGRLEAREAVRKLSRKMDGGAHLLLLAHGELRPGRGPGKRVSHRVHISGRGSETIPTRLLLRRVLEPLAARRRAKGIGDLPFVIVQSCGGGALRDAIRPGTDLWRSAYFLVLSGRRVTSFSLTAGARAAAITYLGQCESRRERPDPFRLMCIAGLARGDCVTLMGGDLEQPLVWHAPQSTEQLDQWVAMTRVRGSLRDQARLLACLRSQDAEQAALVRVPSTRELLLNRILRDDVDAVETIIENAGAAEVIGLDTDSWTIDEMAMNSALAPAPRCLALLLDSGANANACNSAGASLLECYLKESRPYQKTPENELWLLGLQRLLEEGADPNHAAPGEPTPLMLATAAGNPPAIQLLLAHGASMGEPYKGRHCLSVAAANHDADAIRLLLQHGAGPNEGLSQELIDQCVQQGSLEVALILMDALHGKELPVAPVNGAKRGPGS